MEVLNDMHIQCMENKISNIAGYKACSLDLVTVISNHVFHCLLEHAYIKDCFE